MTRRILALGMLMLSALAAGADERCAQKTFPANAHVRSDDVNDLFGRVAPADKPMRFAFVAASAADPVLRQTQRGIQVEAERFGIGIDMRGAADAFAGDPAAVLFAGAADWKRLTDEARSRGIPAIAVGGRVEGARLSVAADRQAFGAMAGEYLHELFPLGASLGYLSAPNPESGADGLADGFAKEIAFYSNLALVGSMATGGTKDAARTATAAIMAAHPEIKGLYVGSDEAAVGAVQSLKSLQLFDVAVVGTGGTRPGRDALAQRSIKGTVARFPDREGAIAVQAGLRLAACQQLPPWLVPPQVTLTSKSIEDIPPIAD